MEWLRNEILTGLQKLLCLSLERTPAAEVIPGTAQVWVETMTNGRHWSRERDAVRIRQAFVTLALTRKTWPVPRDLIEAIPPVQPQRALPPRAADPARAKREIAKARRLLRAPDPAARKEAPPVARERSLAEIEEELKRLYSARAEEREAVADAERPGTDL